MGLGVLLRVLLTRAQTPALIGLSDSVWYLIAAHTNVFIWAADPSGGHPWPAGYPAFLGLIYQLDRHLSVVIAIQHLLGIGTAVLWYLTLRRVVSALWALVPAAVILLAGPQLLVEHAALAETLFSFLLASVVYCAVRALDGGVLVWGALAGLLAAGAGCVRVIGLILIPVLALWLLLVIPGDTRRRLLVAGAALLAAGLLVEAYLVEMKHETDYGGPALTRAGSWGTPGVASQPGVSYASRVGHDLTRYWRSSNQRNHGGYNYSGLVTALKPTGVMDRNFTYQYLTRGFRSSNVIWWYDTTRTEVNGSLRRAMFRYERLTRLEDVRFVLLLLLGIAGLVLARGRQRAVGALALAMAAVVLITPVLYVFFDARYAIPGYGPLAAAAAIGAAAIWGRFAARRAGSHPSRFRVSLLSKSILLSCDETKPV